MRLQVENDSFHAFNKKRGKKFIFRENHPFMIGWLVHLSSCFWDWKHAFIIFSWGHCATFCIYLNKTDVVQSFWVFLEQQEVPQQHTVFSLSYWQSTWVQRKSKKHCRRLTGVASLVHHQHIGANANYPTDIALELPVGQPDTARRGEGLGFGTRLWAVQLGPGGVDHAQVFRALLLLHAIHHVTGQPTLLITASLNFNVTGWKRGQGGATV